MLFNQGHYEAKILNNQRTKLELSNVVTHLKPHGWKVSGRTYTRKCLVDHTRKVGEMRCCLRKQQLLILDGGLEQKGWGHYVYVRPSWKVLPLT